MVYSGCDDLKITDYKPETNYCNMTIEGTIATITLNRKEVYNALNEGLMNELIQLLIWTKERSVGENNDLQDSNGDKYLRILVLKSAGKHF